MTSKELALMALGAVLSAVIGWLLTLLARVPAVAEHAWPFLCPARFRHLKGRWRAIYWYRKGSRDTVLADRIRLKRTGAFLRGRGHSVVVQGSAPNKRAKYAMKGTIFRDGHIRGTWKSLLPYARYHGVFLGRIRANGLIVDVRWIGTSDDDPMPGEWIWYRGRTKDVARIGVLREQWWPKNGKEIVGDTPLTE